MSLEIRTAEVGEAPVVAAMLQEANAFKLSRGDNAWGRHSFTPAEVEGSLAEGETYLGLVDGEPAGTLRLIWEDSHFWQADGSDENAGYIHRLAVAGKFRGLGPTLVDWAAEQVLARQREYLRLDCSAENDGLRNYYEKLGFAVIRQRTLQNPLYTVNLFQKEL